MHTTLRYCTTLGFSNLVISCRIYLDSSWRPIAAEVYYLSNNGIVFFKTVVNLYLNFRLIRCSVIFSGHGDRYEFFW